jgi:hypothetical protein
MKKPSKLLLLGCLAIFAASCGDNTTSTTTEKTTDSTATAVTPAPAAITLADVPASPEFPGAALSIASANAAAQGPDSSKVSFAFNVKNYELKNQTSDASGKMCNNSDKGQHIHFILDNKPYVALYEPKQEVTLPVNTEHYLIAFLSRSYHESIKSEGAAMVYHFKIDEKGNMKKLEDPTTPMLFYSRPKGDYLGKDIENILLDFYTWKAPLGADYTVKADIKNETTGANATFNLNEWKPKFIHGLGEGKCAVTLTLMDKDGRPVAGANTTVTRNFNTAVQEPMKN